MENYEHIQHSGVKGMKWGVRRYQRKDGSLTALGKIRYNTNTEFKSQVDKQNRAKKAREALAAKKEQAAKREQAIREGKLSAKDMSDEELYRALTRSRLSAEYERLNPPAVSKGKKFASKVLNDVVIPASTNAGKKFLENALNKFGDNLLKDVKDPNSISELEKTAKKLELQKKIKDLKNPEESIEKKIRDLENQRKYEDLNDSEYQKLKRDAEKAGYESKINTAKKIKSDASKKAETTEKTESTESKKTEDHSEKTTTERYEPKPEDIIGEGKSKSSIKNGDEWVTKKSSDWNVKSHTPETVERGEDYVDRLWANEEEYLGRLLLP